MLEIIFVILDYDYFLNSPHSHDDRRTAFNTNLYLRHCYTGIAALVTTEKRAPTLCTSNSAVLSHH
jgi:hypothetical protein